MSEPDDQYVATVQALAEQLATAELGDAEPAIRFDPMTSTATGSRDGTP